MEKSFHDRLCKLPFDQYQRYHAMRESINYFRTGNERLRILDVGGYLQGGGQEKFVPASAFLPDDRVWVLDVKYNGPGNYCVGSGSELPFHDSAFDVVVSLDTLEHIAPRSRKSFILEMCRTAARGVHIACPVDHPLTNLAENILDHVIQKLFKVKHPALAEHLEYGLPETALIESWIQEAGLKTITFSDGFLPNWLFMMLIKHYLMTLDDPQPTQESFDKFYNLSLGNDDRREPSYRKVFLGFKDSAKRDDIACNMPTNSSVNAVDETYGLQLSNLLLLRDVTELNQYLHDFFKRNPSWMELFDLAEERHKIILQKDDLIMQQLKQMKYHDELQQLLQKGLIEKDHTIKELTKRQQSLQQNIDEKDQKIRELTAFQDRIKHTFLYRIYSRLKYGKKRRV
ncbi:methyltransferase domain-containing protein [bacterium]|nr:methyltransferase domain-containing protein [candidate division CSSED10-310 bacterium]